MLNLKQLDQLLAELGGSAGAGKESRGPCALLVEHLRSARTSLLGAMPGEFKSSLEEAKASAACISNKDTQADIKKRLQDLICSH